MCEMPYSISYTYGKYIVETDDTMISWIVEYISFAFIFDIRNDKVNKK